MRRGTGLVIFELLNAIYKSFFEVVRRFPQKVVLPIFPEGEDLFWAAAVGEILPAIQAAVETNYSQGIDIEKPLIGANNYASILQSHPFLPGHIVRYQLETERVGGARNDAYAFYMDATSFSDVVDFWNLRTLGRAVFPVPKQFVDVPEYTQLMKDFVRNQYRVSRHNPTVTWGTTMIRSYSSAMEDLMATATALELNKLLEEIPDTRPLA